MGTGKTRGTGHLRPLESKVGLEPTSPRRVSLSGFFRQRCSLWAMPRDCGSQRGLLKTRAALPDFRLNDFDGIHSLMDELLYVPLKETNPPPESDSEISAGLRPLSLCLHQTPQRI